MRPAPSASPRGTTPFTATCSTHVHAPIDADNPLSERPLNILSLWNLQLETPETRRQRASPPMESPGVALLLLAAWVWARVEAAAGAAAGGCTYAHALGILAADCHGLQLRHAPASLRADIQALDLSFNRLRALPALGAYARLELLYADDNAIAVLPEDALRQLPRLRVLSLRLNSITTVPASLLNALPALRRLDLSENPLLGPSLAAALALAPPTSPLEALSVAACGLPALPLPAPPIARPLPALRTLNVSGNPLRAPLGAAQRLAPLCGLRRLVLDGTWASLGACDCTWLRATAMQEKAGAEALALEEPLLAHCRRVEAGDAGDSGDAGDAGDAGGCGSALAAAAEVRGVCLAAGAALTAAERRAAALRLWGGVVGAAGAALLLVLCSCCVWRRRRRRPRSCKDYYDGIPMKTTK